jgi:hypothetical protein
MKTTAKRAVEMTGPTAPATILGKVEIQKRDSHFPSVVVSLITNSERRFP